jgi:uncharacterized protein (TIGR03435 family)
MGKSLYPLVSSVLGGILCFSMGVSGFSQSNGNVEDAKSSRFDVVSIRPSGDSRQRRINVLPDGYEAIDMPLETSIIVAYTPGPFFKHLDDVKGIPSWAQNDHYDFQAKVAPSDVAQWRSLNQNMMRTSPMLQSMLRVALAERCKLRIHSAETTTTGYVLHVQDKSLPLVEDSKLPVGDQGFELLDGARAVISMQDGEQIYTFYNTSMPVLATFLTMTSKQTVEDRTSLSGRYKFALRHITYLSSDEDTAPQVDMPMPWDLRVLGMKIDKEKVKSTVWVVDSMEKPSPN